MRILIQTPVERRIGQASEKFSEAFLFVLGSPVSHSLILVFHSPVQQSLAVTKHCGKIFGVSSQVVLFTWIVSEVEKQGRNGLVAEMDVFVLIVSDYPEKGAVWLDIFQVFDSLAFRVMQ